MTLQTNDVLAGNILQRTKEKNYTCLFLFNVYFGISRCNSVRQWHFFVSFLAHLSQSDMVSFCGQPMSVVRQNMHPSTISKKKIFFSTTTLHMHLKLHTNVPLVKLYQNCSKSLIPCRTLFAMGTKSKNFKNLLLQNHKA